MKIVKWQVFVMIVTAMSGFSQGRDGDWKLIIDTKVSHGVTLCGFESPEFGVTVGPHGETHYTSDSGKTWPQSITTVQCRFGLDILDERYSVSTGNGGVCISCDSGKSFATLMSERYDLLSFRTAENGWLATKRAAIETVDGGKTWHAVPLPDTLKEIRTMSITGPGAGFVLDSAGCLYHTEDCGVTWVRHPVSVSDPGIGFVHNLSSLRFADSKSGALVTWYRKGDDKGWILLTTKDAGLSWSYEKINAGVLGVPYLSRDTKLLTVFDNANNRVMLIGKS
jgi:photosystem II stability/assembly factor-like uncharacterized protein